MIKRRCLGGPSASQPRRWYRGVPGDVEREERGRVEGCKVQGRPTLHSCYGCPAFRGIDRDGIVQGPFHPDGELRAMSAQEYDAFTEADDQQEYARRLEEGSPWNLQKSGTLDWNEWWAAWMRDYRKRMSDEQRSREREVTRARVARWRASRNGRVAVT